MKKNIFCFAITIMFFANAIKAQDNWNNQNPPTSPQGINNSAMAYIGGDKVLLFGGLVQGPGIHNTDDTWIYDLSDNTWTLKNPSTRPSARSGHGMAYIGGDKVLLYGGGDETWIYDLSDNSWTLKNPASS